MTPDPVYVGPRTLVSAAKALMASRHVRHLPVVEAGEIAGLLSDHHVRHAAASNDTPVEEIMARDPLVVAPTTPVADVAQSMLDRGRRCVLVANGKTLLGIFTSADALILVGAHDDPKKAERPAPTCDRWGHVLRR
jgi:acetoin utilization protein AcuB